MYVVRDEDLFLIPTAEVPLTNLYRDGMLEAQSLPRGFARTRRVSAVRRKRVEGHARRAARSRVRQGRGWFDTPHRRIRERSTS
jgi:seryl-tRNA synthetase